jgi:ribosomal protein S25
MAHGSLSQFKATLARKKARKDKNQGKFNRKKLGFKSSDEKAEFNFPELEDSTLEKVKKDIRQKLKVQKRFELIILFILLLAGFIILLYINGFFN